MNLYNDILLKSLTTMFLLHPLLVASGTSVICPKPVGVNSSCLSILWLRWNTYPTVGIPKDGEGRRNHTDEDGTPGVDHHVRRGTDNDTASDRRVLDVNLWTKKRITYIICR